MLERESIKKETINKYLQDNLNDYIEELIKESSIGISDSNIDIVEYYRVLLNLPNNIDIDLIVDRLSDQDMNELKLDFDIVDNNYSENVIVEHAAELLMSIGLLEVQPFINNEIDCYNVFLSHCSWDAREILGIKLLLEKKHSKRTYVDWIDDKQANFPRATQKILDVIKEVAHESSFRKIEKIYKQIKFGKNNIKDERFISNLIIDKLSKSNSLFYIQSRHYDHSRWMPFEVGLAESSKKYIYRLPIKYKKTRKKFGKRSGFLIRYSSIVDRNQMFKNKKMNII